MAKKNDPKKLVSGLFGQAEKSVKGTAGPLFRLHEMQAKFGTRRYLSTGYPSFDMHLMHNKERTEYGFPYGRIVGIHGASGALKTTFTYQSLAKNVAKGGHSLYLTTEDFDADYAEMFLQREGMTGDLSQYDYSAKFIHNMDVLDETVKAFLKPYVEAADKLEDMGEDPLDHLPPIMIGCDSIGALIAGVDHKRLEKKGIKEGKQVGVKASEIHSFFQLNMMKFARLGVLFLYTNHFRDNIGFGNAKYTVAHDSALKYYATLRVRVQRGWDKDMMSKKSSANREYRQGWPFVAKIYKIRQETVLAGEVEIPYVNTMGLDYTASLVDAGMMSGVAKLWGGVYTIDVDDDHYLAPWNGKYAKADLRDLIKENAEFRVKLEKASLKAGAESVQEFD